MKEEREQKRKSRVLHECKRCGFRFSKEKAMCPSCKAWNAPGVVSRDDTVLLSETKTEDIELIQTGPWDRCFGMPHFPAGPIGIVSTGIVLLGGSPGAGKSTVILQISDRIAQLKSREVLYIAAEQASSEIRLTAERLNLASLVPNQPAQIRIYPLGSTSDLGDVIVKYRPAAIILDSVDGLCGDPAQAVETAKRMKPYCVDLRAPCIMVAHINKDFDFAGEMDLQHEVDTLITLFPVTDDEQDPLRIMQSHKNRFGPTTKAFLSMTPTGLQPGYNPEEKRDDDE